MLNKITLYICALMLVVMMAACSNDKFKMVGEFPDGKDQTLIALYVNEAGLQEVNIPLVEGKFEFEGYSPNFTVVHLYNDKKKLITEVVLKNGDKLKLKGTLKHAALMEITGNKDVEDWNKFRKDNHLLYSEDNTEVELDKKIEAYIEANGDKMASLLMLIYDYSDLTRTERVNELLNMINEECRAASILKAYTDMNAEWDKKSEKTLFPNLEFYNEIDSFVSLATEKSNTTIIYFYNADDDKKLVNRRLDSLYTAHDKKGELQIADVVMDGDTLRWKRTVKREKYMWNRFIAVGGFMNPNVVDLDVKTTPNWVVLDSVGAKLYQGDSIECVIKTVSARLDKKQD